MGGDEEATSKEEEDDDDDDDDDAWERTKNALVDARATTAIRRCVFVVAFFTKVVGVETKVSPRLCREETRTRERKSDDETKKETRDDEDDDDDDDGRGFARS